MYGKFVADRQENRHGSTERQANIPYRVTLERLYGHTTTLLHLILKISLADRRANRLPLGL